jgi:ABC-type lipoprotein release transport system permease subunit
MKPLTFLSHKLFFKEKFFLGLPLLLCSLAMSILFSSFCIFSGLRDDFLLQIKHHQSHISLQPKSIWFENQQDILKELQNLPESSSYQKLILSQGLLKMDLQTCGVLIRGDKNRNCCNDDNCICVSKALISDFEQSVLSNNNQATLILPDGEHKKVHWDTFDDRGWLDKKYSVVLSYNQAEKWIADKDLFNRVEIILKSPEQAPQIAKSLTLPQDVLSSTWLDEYKETLKLFSTELKIHGIILILLMLFIFAGIYGCFYLTLFRKQSSLNTLKKLGMTHHESYILFQFVLHCFASGAICGGLFISYLVYSLLVHLPLELPQSLFYSQFLPFHWKWDFFAIISLILYLTIYLAFSRARKQLGL